MRGLLTILVLQFSIGWAYRILALAPYNGHSHWYIFQPLLEELANRGNDVTVLSHFPRQTPLKNYRDISLYNPANSPIHVKDVHDANFLTRIKKMNSIFQYGVDTICNKSLQHPRVQELLRSNQTYDVIIMELFNSDCFLGFVHKFRAPLVAIRSAPLSPWSNDRMANPDNPSYMPNSLLGKSTRMNFRDRLENFLSIWYYKMAYDYYNDKCTEIVRSHFGHDLPPLAEIARNTSMILINSHFALQYARPLVSGMKEIAGIHLKKPKELPKEIDDWISGARDGVIFFSFGSMLKSSSMSISKRNAFIEAFGQLPQRVLMKWEEDSSIDNLPGNIKLFNWTQQYDILCHPNVKVFISHGGMLSTTEAVYSGTPMIVIPMYGDQPTNAALLQEKGLAILLEYRTITKDILLTALNRILQEPQYRETAKMMSDVIRDRLVPPLEEAAYWVEYVARYKGATFMRSPALELPLYQYLLLDVLAALFFIVLAIFMLLVFIVRFLFKLILGRSRKVSPKSQTKPTKRE